MPGPAPKADADRRRRNEPTFAWTILPPEGRKGRTPAMPKRAPSGEPWHPRVRPWWRRLWHKPQATQWDEDDAELYRLLVIEDRLWKGEASAAELAEARQIEDRHGLNPKAMLQLRWRLGQVREDDQAEPEERRATSGRFDHLRVVEGDAAAGE